MSSCAGEGGKLVVLRVHVDQRLQQCQRDLRAVVWGRHRRDDGGFDLRVLGEQLGAFRGVALIVGPRGRLANSRGEAANGAGCAAAHCGVVNQAVMRKRLAMAPFRALARMRPFFFAAPIYGSVHSGSTSTRPVSSATGIVANGISTNLTVVESPPFSSIHARVLSSAMPLSELTPIVLPLRSFA